MKTVATILFLLFSFISVIVAEGGDTPEMYTSSEKKQLASKTLNNRVKVYNAAFERIWKKMNNDMIEERFGDAARTLSAGSAILAESLADIELNANLEKKPGKLKTYEINMRKVVNELRSLRLRGPAELQDSFAAFMEQTESTRRRLMDIIFG